MSGGVDSQAARSNSSSTLISAGVVAGVTGSPLESLVSVASEMMDWSFAPVRAFLASGLAGGIAGVSVCDRRASVIGYHARCLLSVLRFRIYSLVSVSGIAAAVLYGWQDVYTI